MFGQLKHQEREPSPDRCYEDIHGWGQVEAGVRCLISRPRLVLPTERPTVLQVRTSDFKDALIVPAWSWACSVGQQREEQ